SDRPNVDPAPPVAPSDVHNGHGLGRLDGGSGAYADWRIIDKGEPGTKDRIAITIWDHQGGNVVIQTVGKDGSYLDQGNQQAHYEHPCSTDQAGPADRSLIPATPAPGPIAGRPRALC